MAIKLIPFNIVDELAIEDNGCAVVEPKPRRRYTLAELLAASDYSQQQSAEVREWLDTPDVGEENLDRLIDGVTPDNLHSEVSLGVPVGKEVL